jgi:DNA polymerase III subunit alpha, Gram-positive type
MTTADIRKNKFNYLASKCFDEKTLKAVELKQVFFKKESNSYFAVFKIDTVLTFIEENRIALRCKKVFENYPSTTFCFDYSQLIEGEKKILEYINQKLYLRFVPARPFLSASHTYIKNKQFHMDFKTSQAMDMFFSVDVEGYLKEILQFNFDIHYPIVFGVNENLDDENTVDYKIIEPMVIEHEKEEKKQAQVSEQEVKEKQAKAVTQKPKPKKAAKPKKPTERITVISGKEIRKKVIDIADISDETHKVCIIGEVIDTEVIKCKNGSMLVIINITDYTSTIQCKMFLGEKIFKARIGKLKSGWLKIEGEVSFDLRQKSFSLKPINISSVQKPKKQDLAQNKRVELHLHTVMSAEDATINIKSVIDRAKDYGHKAIAITDHGVVQAFPIADGYAEKVGIDIIYGMEAYMTLGRAEIFTGNKDISLNGTFVVADIETTGFSPVSEAITEIGAVRIVNGEIIEKFSTFVDPEKPIPHNITQITGITTEMVKGAPSQETAIHMFKDFAGDDCIVAHNAKFDMSFFRTSGTKHGVSFKQNSVLDTLGLSQCLLSQNKRHNLKAVANHFSIPLNHHRALNDATATGEALICFIKMLKDRKINSTYQINSGLSDCVSKKNEKVYHVILLCKNKKGLRNLYEIVSESHINGFYKRPRITKSFIESHKEGLLIGSACEQGEVFTAVLNGQPDKDIEKIIEFYDYLEIQPDGNNEFMIREGMIKDKSELHKINKRIIKLGENKGKLTVATCDAHFIDERDSVFREVMMTMKGFNDAHLQPPLYYRTTDEMLSEFKYLGDEAEKIVVDNTKKIYQQIEKFELLPKETSMPKIENADKMLWEIARKTAKEMYGDVLPEIVEKRLNKEMGAICEHGFAVLYYIAHVLIADSLANGFIVGSRGSVGSSFAATMTGVTEVNPLPPHYRCGNCKYSDFSVDHSKCDCGVDLPDQICPKCGQMMIKDGFDIPFETFLGLNADKVPDIDLNFSGEYQAKAHDFTIQYFGKEHVFRAGTITTLAEKTAMGYVQNYFDENGLTRPFAERKRLAKGLIGVKKSTGKHPGGLVVLPKDKSVYDYTPIQRPANDMTSDSKTTHFDFDSLHDRLVKLDILGHDDPTMLKLLSDLTGLDARMVPLKDEQTMKLFSGIDSLGIKGDTLLDTEVGTYGVPEFGTKFVRGVLTLTRPTTMAELIRISGLSHGADVWKGNADLLVKQGTATLGEVIATRDDIMNAMVIHGIDPKLSFFTMERVRKGKGLTEKMEQAMIKNKMPQWFIDSCKKITYMFPKAHAVAYVTMALRIAYYKVHYPKAYYATYFSIRAKNFDATYVFEGVEAIKAHIKDIEKRDKEFKATANETSMITNLELAYEMYQRGIDFLPVDINKSEASQFTIEDEGIRMPFSALPGVGESAAEHLKKQAEISPYVSKQDIVLRAKVSKTVIDTMDKFGCLVGLTSENQISFFDQL